MTFDRAIALNEIRYAERLCQRTARLYRRLQTAGVFLSALAGTAAIGSLSQLVPASAGAVGSLALAVVGAALLAVRPGDKAIQNEADVKRYAQLRAAAVTMDDTQFEQALQQARELDAPEVEPLRDVAWNDVMGEIGRPELRMRLRPAQRVLAALA